MKRLFTPLALLAVICTPVWGQSNSGGAIAGVQAVIPLVDPVGVTDSNLVSDCAGPASTFLADNSYSLTLTTAKLTTIGSVDLACIGDYYETRLNGLVFNTTPNPFDYCGAADPWGCVTGTCTPHAR